MINRDNVFYFTIPENIAALVVRSIISEFRLDSDDMLLLPNRWYKFVTAAPPKQLKSVLLLHVRWYYIICCFLNLRDLQWLDVVSVTADGQNGIYLAAKILSELYPNGFRFVPDMVYDTEINPPKQYSFDFSN